MGLVRPIIESINIEYPDNSKVARFTICATIDLPKAHGLNLEEMLINAMKDTDTPYILRTCVEEVLKVMRV